MAGSQFDLPAGDWAALRSLLDEALALPAPARSAWLDRLDDSRFAALKPRLCALLDHHESPFIEGLLNTIPKIETDQFAPALPPAPAGTPQPGVAIGPYRLLRLLGEGGMATVWLAERVDMLQGRKVALKLPHGAWRRAGLAERLAREREILATLEHPNIARLYDAGVAADGQPYLALEHVEGQRIDEYCRRRSLGLPQRLQLLLQVCAAVAYAHTRLVVHRDLKPGNILVTASGEVRLLDFGIAKLLEPGEVADSPLTRDTGRALTPDYAAPEQIQGQAIGTAADVYSLGVVMFELLCGVRPYRLQRGSRAELEEAILQAEPPRPSEACADPGLRRRLRGDLDNIVLKALKKAPAERYPTVDALADDIGRHLADEPVLARPDGRWYRASRFVRRHRWGIGASATLALAVLAGSAVSLWQAHAARDAQARAEEVRAFLTDILQGADLYRGDGARITAADLLEQARLKIDRTLVGRPDLKLEMQTLIGLGIFNLHEPKVAEALMRQAVADGTAAFGVDHDQVLRAREVHALTLRYAGDPEALRRELATLVPALRARERTHAAELARALESQVVLANGDGRHADAERDSREMLAVAQRHLGAQHPLTIDAQWSLIAALQLQKKADEALTLARVAYPALLARHDGNLRVPAVIEAGEKYGRVLALAGDRPAALKQLTQVVDDAAAVFGAESVAVGFFAANLANLQIDDGDVQAGLVNIERSLKALARAPGVESPPYATARGRRATLLLAARRPLEAAADWRQATADWARLRGAGSPAAVAARAELARALAEGGKSGAAWSELASLPAPDDAKVEAWAVSRALAEGRLRRDAGDARTALDLHAKAFEAASANPPDPARRVSALFEQGLDRLALGEHEQAVAVLDQAIAAAAAWPRPTPALAEIWLAAGRAQLGAGRAAVAQGLLQQADTFWRAFDAGHSSAGESAVWLARSRAVLGSDPAASRPRPAPKAAPAPA